MVESKTINSLAMRILGPMESFDLEAIPPGHVGDAIGVYNAGEGTVPLWVTSTGLVRGDERTVLRFDSMAEVHAPTSKSRGEPESTRISLVMDDGSNEIIEVAGGRGRFCDSFEFTRFLSRAVGLSRL